MVAIPNHVPDRPVDLEAVPIAKVSPFAST